MNRGLMMRLAALIVLAALCFGGVKLGIWLRQRQVTSTQPMVTVSFLEVTDGDCTVIQTPDEHTIVIDTGGAANGDEVPRTLRRMGVIEIDLLVLAAPTDQAEGGVDALLKANLPIRSVWINSVAKPGTVQTQAIALLQAKNVPIQTVYENEKKSVGDSPMALKVLWPPRNGDRTTKDNLVCRVDYGAQSCLFLGPLAAESEPYLISGAADPLKADVMQVTDHGAGEGTERELLPRVQPEIAVISSTAQSPPAPATLERLQSAAADVWRTDIQGTVTVTLSTSPNTPTVTGSRL